MEIRLSLNELETFDADDVVQVIEYVQNQVEMHDYIREEYVIGNIFIIILGG
ncbi:hypothetical protein LCGC14_1526810 [marine sediment metagenome]|uniref:Uncharacterized protein n=1 Tax=marine sediment metagenome TaxID=412755 RepID=A0A0F9IXD1_9ZZZZ